MTEERSRPVRILRDEKDCAAWAAENCVTGVADPRDPEPRRCPVCDGEWHADGCELGEEVSRRLKAETEARTLRCRYAVVSGWIVEALKVLDTLDPEDTTEADELRKLVKAGEVLALTALAQSKPANVF